MLDALDTFLGNKKLVSQLSASDLQSFKEHRHDVFAKLAAYRAINLFTKRGLHNPIVVPSGPHQGMAVPVAIGGIMLGAQSTTVGGATVTATGGWEAAAVFGEGRVDRRSGLSTERAHPVAQAARTPLTRYT
jgi:hypothetical protein